MEPNHSATGEGLFESLRRHRAELRESMSALEGALAAPAMAGPEHWLQRVQAALMELSADVREHIDITEGPDGLYQDVLRTSPQLSGAVASLTAEHVLITGGVAAALTHVTTPDAIENVERIRELGTALLGRLVRHRQRGSDLVFGAYQIDSGGEA